MKVMDTAEKVQQAPIIALVLGFLGLLPFWVPALALSMPSLSEPLKTLAINALVFYAALIFSFLGGIHWGAALSQHGKGHLNYTLSIFPTGLAFLLVFLDPFWSLLSFALLFAALGAYDAWLAKMGAFPHWHGKLRIHLTLGAVPALVLAFILV